MSYCTYAEVQADFKNTVFDSGSFVTSADVTQFIVEADALIDSWVSNRYVTPITADSTSLALMKLFSRTLVAERVRKIMEVKQVTNTDANQAVRGAGLSTKDVMAMLKQIQNGDLGLSGASLVLDSAAFYSNNYATGVNPTFRKGSKQW